AGGRAAAPAEDEHGVRGLCQGEAGAGAGTGGEADAGLAAAAPVRPSARLLRFANQAPVPRHRRDPHTGHPGFLHGQTAQQAGRAHQRDPLPDSQVSGGSSPPGLRAGVGKPLVPGVAGGSSLHGYALPRPQTCSDGPSQPTTPSWDAGRTAQRPPGHPQASSGLSRPVTGSVLAWCLQFHILGATWPGEALILNGHCGAAVCPGVPLPAGISSPSH
uniref:Uncharacterized protein n=1 Tax=Gopherus agassizii TaxID=38772 RepID=A0A452H124_9SAUR